MSTARMAFAMLSAAALGGHELQTTTWAARPAAASQTGGLIIVSDIGVGGGSLWFSDGARWVPAAPITLARSAVKIGIPNNTLTTEQTYVSVPLPAGAMGINGAVYVDTLWTYTGSTNAKTFRVRLGGIGGAQIVGTAVATATNVSSRVTGLIRNRNAANSQVFPNGNLTGNGGASSGSGTVQTSAIDTAVAQTIVFDGITATAGEVLDLEWYEVRLIA